MQVDVISSVNEARSDDFINKTVIVIDVLRATSVIVTALAHRCRGVVPAETVQQAKSLQQSDDLLGGERFCKKIAGFDFGNSPLEYMTLQIEGKKVILTTTNGTRAIQKTQKAANVLTGSLLNAMACANAARQLKRDVMIVCAGTQDQFSLEDGLCAGLILEEMKKEGEEVETNDLGTAMISVYRNLGENIEHALLNCSNGKKLSRLGFQEDVLYCSLVNRYDFVPVLKGEMLVLNPQKPFID